MVRVIFSRQMVFFEERFIESLLCADIILGYDYAEMNVTISAFKGRTVQRRHSGIVIHPLGDEWTPVPRLQQE